MSDYALVNDGTPINLCNDGEEEVKQDDDYTYVYGDDDATYITAYDNYIATYSSNDDASQQQVVNAYNVDDAYFNVDDAYFNTYQVNDSEECPQNGVYGFEIEFTVPQFGRMWRSTGWKAYGSVQLAAHGEMLGSCALVFETKAFGLSSKKFFTIFVTVMGVAVFVGVFLAIRRGGGYGASDDAKDFHYMTDEVIHTVTSPCTHPKKDKKDEDDLERTFESNSTPSRGEKEDSLETTFADTTFDTRVTPGTPVTPGARPTMVRGLIRAHSTPSSPFPTSPDGGMDSFHRRFNFYPPSPIRSEDFETYQDHSMLHSTRDDSSVQYDPQRGIV